LTTSALDEAKGEIKKNKINKVKRLNIMINGQ
jgi:hypothetical protein